MQNAKEIQTKDKSYTINELLEFNFNPSNYASLAENIFSKETKKSLSNSINEIRKLGDDLSDAIIKKPQDIKDVYLDFMSNRNNSSSLTKSFNNMRKVKKLTWALNYKTGSSEAIVNTEYFIHALELIKNNWSYTMVIPLFDLLITEWRNIKLENLSTLKAFLKTSLSSYDKNLPTIIKIKRNINFFCNHDGLALLLRFCLDTRIKITDITSYLGISDTYKNSFYFYDLAYLYTSFLVRNYKTLDKNYFKEYLEDILIFLENASKDAIKACLSKIVIFVDQNSYLDLKEEVKSYSFKNIGDPSNDSQWLPWKGASDTQIRELDASKNIINLWLNEQFIELFFSKLAMDVNRKRFWQKYLNRITRFKICGSEDLYRELNSDKRVQPYLKSRFSFLNGKKSALIMIIKDYVLIEFSTTGHAFYGYEKSNSSCPDISKSSFREWELKHKLHANIWIAHSGNWENKITRELHIRNII